MAVSLRRSDWRGCLCQPIVRRIRTRCAARCWARVHELAVPRHETRERALFLLTRCRTRAARPCRARRDPERRPAGLVRCGTLHIPCLPAAASRSDHADTVTATRVAPHRNQTLARRVVRGAAHLLACRICWYLGLPRWEPFNRGAIGRLAARREHSMEPRARRHLLLRELLRQR